MTATPDTWKTLMERAGIASIRQLAKTAGFADHTIVNRVIMKGTTTSAENMVKIAVALRVPVEQLYEIHSGVAATPFTPPKGTEKLSEDEKEALAKIIRSMVRSKEDDEGFVYKKSAGSTEQAQEKTGSVTPIGGYKWRTPAQQRFEDTGRRVAKIKREMPQDSPKIPPASPDTDK